MTAAVSEELTIQLSTRKIRRASQRNGYANTNGIARAVAWMATVRGVPTAPASEVERYWQAANSRNKRYCMPAHRAELWALALGVELETLLHSGRQNRERMHAVREEGVYTL
jgi:hypothetical protein